MSHARHARANHLPRKQDRSFSFFSEFPGRCACHDQYGRQSRATTSFRECVVRSEAPNEIVFIGMNPSRFQFSPIGFESSSALSNGYKHNHYCFWIIFEIRKTKRERCNESLIPSPWNVFSFRGECVRSYALLVAEDYSISITMYDHHARVPSNFIVLRNAIVRHSSSRSYLWIVFSAWLVRAKVRPLIETRVSNTDSSRTVRADRRTIIVPYHRAA